MSHSVARCHQTQHAIYELVVADALRLKVHGPLPYSDVMTVEELCFSCGVAPIWATEEDSLEDMLICPQCAKVLTHLSRGVSLLDLYREEGATLNPQDEELIGQRLENRLLETHATDPLTLVLMRREFIGLLEELAGSGRLSAEPRPYITFSEVQR